MVLLIPIGVLAIFLAARSLGLVFVSIGGGVVLLLGAAVIVGAAIGLTMRYWQHRKWGLAILACFAPLVLVAFLARAYPSGGLAILIGYGVVLVATLVFIAVDYARLRRY